MNKNDNEKENGVERTALAIFDRLDNELIEAELAGREAAAWAYEFEQQGRTVRGLSVSGVEEASRISAMRGECFRILRWETAEEADAYRAIVEVGRYAVGQDRQEGVLLDSALGAKREPKYKLARSGVMYRDPHAFEAAVSKAARNAKLKLIAPEIKTRVLEQALSAGKVLRARPEDAAHIAKAAAREAAPPPGPKVDEDAARRRFFAAAREAGLGQREIHAVLGLRCGKRLHDGDVDPKTGQPVRGDHARACHALREAIAAWANEREGDPAAAWAYYRARLLDALTEEAP